MRRFDAVTQPGLRPWKGSPCRY